MHPARGDKKMTQACNQKKMKGTQNAHFLPSTMHAQMIAMLAQAGYTRSLYERSYVSCKMTWMCSSGPSR